MASHLFLLLVLAPIALLTTAYVLWPLLRAPSRRDVPADAVREAGGEAASDAALLNREIVQERRLQLDRELAQLPTDSPERDRLILEFSSAALTDLQGSPTPQRRHGPRRWIAAAALAGLLCAGPLAFYRLAGSPDAADPEFARLAEPQDLPSLVSQLEQRLQADPEAADGWLLLGRSKMSLGDLEGATVALERALKLDSPDNALAAQIRVDLADALAQAAASRLAGRPWNLIQEALKRDGRNQKALALAGAYQVTQGDSRAALGYWEPLLAQLPPGTEQHAQIAAFVADLREGRNPGAAAAAPAAPAADGPVLRGRVEIDPSLADRMQPGDTLFIAARGLDAEDRPAGPPVAVLRTTAAELPLAFELSDRQAMTPAARLSGQSRVVVVARISRAGSAASGSGDLEGRSGPVAADAQAVLVRIDRLLP